MKSGFDALGTYCVPLEVGVECGIVGLLAFLAMIVSLFARGHLLFWKTNRPIYRWNSLGLTIALLGLSIQGLVDTVFYRPQVHFIFWLTVAGLTVLSTMAADSENDIANKLESAS
jgi:putative inorganic carbon (HCO3(-)) transporter